MNTSRVTRSLSLMLELLVLLLISVAPAVQAQRSLPEVAGQVTQYPLPPNHNPWGSIASGPDGNMWFTITGELGCIGKLTLQGKFTTYPIPGQVSADPQGITTGPDGKLWFTEQAGAIGRMTTKGKYTNYALGGTEPDGITVGPDTNLWFVETVADEIGTITWR